MTDVGGLVFVGILLLIAYIVIRLFLWRWPKMSEDTDPPVADKYDYR